MIDHFGINCADNGKSQQFYDRVLGVLGYPTATTSKRSVTGRRVGWYG
jgi:hypothetical protein